MLRASCGSRLLESELAHFDERRAEDPGYRWTDTETLKLYGFATGNPIPAEFAALSAGMHDEVGASGRLFVTLVRESDHGREVLALDISGMERSERQLTWAMVGSTALVVTVLAFITHLGAGWLVRPLVSIARRISEFRPDRAGQRVVVERSAPHEADVIVTAVNDYLQRLDEFVERERAFVNMASHELRTPIAVISGAAEVGSIAIAIAAVDRGGSRVSGEAQGIVVRSRCHGAMLDQCSGADCPRGDRQLGAQCDRDSDRGVIKVATADGTKVRIEDPGHGMSDEEMSAVYTRLARSGEFIATAGIGIELISRLCAHLGWRLSFHAAGLLPCVRVRRTARWVYVKRR